MKKLTIGLLSIALLGAGCLGGNQGISDDKKDKIKDEVTERGEDKKDLRDRVDEAVENLADNEIVAVFVVDQESENAPEKGKTIGCEDKIAPIKLTLEEDKSQTDLAEAIVALLTTRSSDVEEFGVRNDVYAKGLYLDNIRTDEEGMRVLELSGELSFGGVCEVPRFKGQIEETVKLYEPDAVIELNGSESEWSCLGDQSGECA